MNLKETLTGIAQRYGYKLTEFSPELFGLDVSLKQQDGSFRYQYAYIRPEQPEGARKKIYISSTCGVYNNSINFYNILKENAYCNFTTITIGSRKNKEGVPEEVIMVQAAPLEEFLTNELLDYIIFEAAFNADYLEKTYFGGDAN
ncbi:MAG: hypothetical protein JNM14_08515 [Ferruginibacter sp.]|nr:hypothetical protein [Ferruginibacter sp.]